MVLAPQPGQLLSTSPAESEANPCREAHRPGHAKPHPQEQSQDPAKLQGGETKAEARGNEVDMDPSRQELSSASKFPSRAAHLHAPSGCSERETPAQ